MLTLTNSCNDQKQAERNYWGTSVKRTIFFYNKNGTISKKLFLFKNEGFDGFWESYYCENTKDQTLLYLNGILDTSWYWKNGRPVDIYNVPYDTIQLKKYTQEKVAVYLNKNQND